MGEEVGADVICFCVVAGASALATKIASNWIVFTELLPFQGRSR